MAIDEAQLLRYMRGRGRVDIARVIAYCYDNLRNLKFVVTGSEIGVLRDFLGFDDPNSWLYGRIRDEVVLERFDRDRSIDFLYRGFDECGVKPPESVVEEIVDRVDGVPGWLTYFGYRYCQNPDPQVIDEVAEEAKKMVLNELRKLPSRYYLATLRVIAMGAQRWRDIKLGIELVMGHTVADGHLGRALETLVKLSLVEKRDNEYRILDPVICEAAKEV